MAELKPLNVDAVRSAAVTAAFGDVDPATVPTMDAQDLRNLVEALTTRLSDAAVAHHTDMRAVSERMHREATSRNWCSEFGAIINDVNASGLTVALDVPV